MLLSFEDLLKYSIRAQDGPLGSVTDMLCSDDTWTVRYLVVKAGDTDQSESEGRGPILLSPMALEPLDRQEKIVPIHLTTDRVKNAPPLDAHKPVSRHYEAKYYDYFGWPYYWAGGPIWGPFFTPGESARTETRLIRKSGGEVEPPEHPHLRSAEEIRTYRFEDREGRALGPIEDFIIDEDTYRVKYLQLKTRRWLPGRHVLLPTERIRSVSWADKKVSAEIPRDVVKAAPERDRSEPIVRLDEQPIRFHYGVMGSESPNADAQAGRTGEAEVSRGR